MLEKPKRRNLLKEHECETCRLHCTFMLTRGILIFILFSLGAPTPTSHFPLHSLVPFSEHPLRYGVLEPPLQAWQPRSTIPGYPHPRSSGISAVALPPVHSGYLSVRGMLEPPQQRVQPQNTMPCYLNLEGSAVTYPQEIPGFLPPHGMQGARLHGLQPQSTMSDDPYLIGPGESTHTYSTVNLESLLPRETLRSPQYGFHPQSASPSYPHLQFSDPVTSAVTHTPVIPGNRTRAPLQAPQPLSASSGDLHLSGPVTSSVTHPAVIPGYSSYPNGNCMRAPLLAPQPQSASSGDPHHSGLMSSVIHSPVIPEYSSYPYGNRMRAPLLAPEPQSASSGDRHVSGPVTPSVTHPQVIPGYSYPYGNHMRAPLLAPQPQSASPGDLHLSGIPGYSYPYGNRMRAPLLAPQPPSASPGDPHLSGPISSVIHPPVIPGFLSPSGMQRGSPEVQHERNPSTESGTWPSQ